MNENWHFYYWYFFFESLLFWTYVYIWYFIEAGWGCVMSISGEEKSASLMKLKFNPLMIQWIQHKKGNVSFFKYLCFVKSREKNSFHIKFLNLRTKTIFYFFWNFVLKSFILFFFYIYISTISYTVYTFLLVTPTWVQFSSDWFLLHFTHVIRKVTLILSCSQVVERNLLLMIFVQPQIQVRFQQHEVKSFLPLSVHRHPSLIVISTRRKLFVVENSNWNRLHKQPQSNNKTPSTLSDCKNID